MQGTFQIHISDDYITQVDWKIYHLQSPCYVSLQIYSFEKSNPSRVLKGQNRNLICFTQDFFEIGSPIKIDTLQFLVQGFPIKIPLEEIEQAIWILKRKLEEKIIHLLLLKKRPIKLP